MKNKNTQNEKVELADKIEEVFDLVDRGVLNSSEEVIAQFEGYNVDKNLLTELVKEEFGEGSTERFWDELEELD
jgi:hypothetical protein